ncbi:uroporphyrinogen-III C-methyltransferase [Ureibacillus sinduriensis]|uniref:Uroporphyrinogen-III C-methyltransferase n=1 Tax=Ureibacillus sinduriensis BLB-1 = JCM 15800 TaxID=1384057 RepID=A0A0A3I443_9BACL|nr:uroporphyrinogen-III C-methyltransferase [Ureibacillus sinduriensis]KGR77438.1 uroporphyrin-III methyltransferase [Ureibacillus sinduriensis BLB-1 = JCM 15800]
MGMVYIVGAGPGDEELITVKGLKCIQTADVILYDRLVNIDLLNYAKKGAKLISCGKFPNYHTMQQNTINLEIVKYAKEGKIVVRLKGGDPFIFGRGAEEAMACREAGVNFQIVPGITAGIAAAAYAGIPVTHRDYSSSFAVITGHRKAGVDADHQWGCLARSVDTLVVYMGMKHLGEIATQLIAHGKDKETPVALIHKGTTNGQCTVIGTLETIYEIAVLKQVKNPSVIIVGEVVRLNKKMRWFEEHNDYLVAGIL